MKKKTAIPKQLFITVQERKEYLQANWWNLPQEERTEVISYLGFLHKHNPNEKGDAKRKATQMDWAYSPYKEKDGILYRVKYSWWRDTESDLRRIVEEVPVADELLPRVWENEGMSGFKILHSVSRSSTSNKLWRVLDPRGIEFEISTGCFEDIVMNSTIIGGEIMDECVWAGNKSLVLCSSL